LSVSPMETVVSPVSVSALRECAEPVIPMITLGAVGMSHSVSYLKARLNVRPVETITIVPPKQGSA